MSESALNTYISDLITAGTIEDGYLTGLLSNGNGRATFSFLRFNTIYEENVLIKSTVDGYKYYKITKEPVLPGVESVEVGDLYQKIEALEEKLNNVNLILSEGLPKDETYKDSYKVDKTDVIIDAWKDYIRLNPDIVHPDIVDGLENYNTPDVDLNQTQIDNKDKVKKWVKKLKARNRIEVEVGDIYDLHADLSKRVAIIERLAMRHFLDYISEYTMIQAYKDAYSAIVKPQIQAVDAGTILDRSDLLDTSEMITELSTRRGKIKDIIKEEMIDPED